MGKPEARDPPGFTSGQGKARWFRIPIEGREEWTLENLIRLAASHEWEVGYHGTKGSSAFSSLALDRLLGSKSTQGGSPSEGRDNVPYLGSDIKKPLSYCQCPDARGAQFWGYMYAWEVINPKSNRVGSNKSDPVTKRGQVIYGPDACIKTALWVWDCHLVDAAKRKPMDHGAAKTIQSEDKKGTYRTCCLMRRTRSVTTPGYLKKTRGLETKAT